MDNYQPPSELTNVKNCFRVHHANNTYSPGEHTEAFLENVRSVERAIKILKAIGAHEKGLTVSEISAKVNLHSATVIRLLSTLKNEDFVIRDFDTLVYKFGNSLINITKNFVQENNFYIIAHPFMQELVEKTKETVALFVASGTKRVCVDRIPGLHAIRWHIEIGDSAPLGISSSGKLLLASCSEQFINDQLNKPLHFINGSLVNTEKLKKELELIKMQGYASSFCENSLDGAGIAAPIKNGNGKIVAALTILGPVSRIDEEQVKSYKETLIFTANKITSKL